MYSSKVVNIVVIVLIFFFFFTLQGQETYSRIGDMLFWK